MFRRTVCGCCGSYHVPPLSRVGIFPIHLDPPTQQHQEMFRLLLGLSDGGLGGMVAAAAVDPRAAAAAAAAISSVLTTASGGRPDGAFRAGGGGGVSGASLFSRPGIITSSGGGGGSSRGISTSNASHASHASHAAPSLRSGITTATTATSFDRTSAQHHRQQQQQHSRRRQRPPHRTRLPPRYWYLEPFAESVELDSQIAPLDDLILIPNTRYPVSLKQSTHLAALSVLAARGIPRLHVDFTALEHPDDSMPVVYELNQRYRNSVLIHWLHDAYEMLNWRNFSEVKMTVPLMLLQTHSIPLGNVAKPPPARVAKKLAAAVAAAEAAAAAAAASLSSSLGTNHVNGNNGGGYCCGGDGRDAPGYHPARFLRSRLYQDPGRVRDPHFASYYARAAAHMAAQHSHREQRSHPAMQQQSPLRWLDGPTTLDGNANNDDDDGDGGGGGGISGSPGVGASSAAGNVIRTARDGGATNGSGALDDYMAQYPPAAPPPPPSTVPTSAADAFTRQQQQQSQQQPYSSDAAAAGFYNRTTTAAATAGCGDNGLLVRGEWWLTKGGRGDDRIEVSRSYSNAASTSWLGAPAAAMGRRRSLTDVTTAALGEEEEGYLDITTATRRHITSGGRRHQQLQQQQQRPVPVTQHGTGGGGGAPHLERHSEGMYNHSGNNHYGDGDDDDDGADAHGEYDDDDVMEGADCDDDGGGGEEGRLHRQVGRDIVISKDGFLHISGNDTGAGGCYDSRNRLTQQQQRQRQQQQQQQQPPVPVSCVSSSPPSLTGGGDARALFKEFAEVREELEEMLTPTAIFTTAATEGSGGCGGSNNSNANGIGQEARHGGSGNIHPHGRPHHQHQQHHLPLRSSPRARANPHLGLPHDPNSVLSCRNVRDLLQEIYPALHLAHHQMDLHLLDNSSSNSGGGGGVNSGHDNHSSAATSSGDGAAVPLSQHHHAPIESHLRSHLQHHHQQHHRHQRHHQQQQALQQQQLEDGDQQPKGLHDRLRLHGRALLDAATHVMSGRMPDLRGTPGGTAHSDAFLDEVALLQQSGYADDADLAASSRFQRSGDGGSSNNSAGGGGGVGGMPTAAVSPSTLSPSPHSAAAAAATASRGGGASTALPGGVSGRGPASTSTPTPTTTTNGDTSRVPTTATTTITTAAAAASGKDGYALDHGLDLYHLQSQDPRRHHHHQHQVALSGYGTLSIPLLPMIEVHPVARSTGADVRQMLWEQGISPRVILTDSVAKYVESHGLYRDTRKSAKGAASAAAASNSNSNNNPSSGSGNGSSHISGPFPSLFSAAAGGGNSGSRGGAAADGGTAPPSLPTTGTTTASSSSSFPYNYNAVRKMLQQRESAVMAFPGIIPRLELHYDKSNLLAREQYEKLKVFQCLPTEEPDLIVPIGGDGYMMHCIRLNWRRFIPFYGVNAGHVGYLLNDCATLEELFSSPLKLHTTNMLYCQAEQETATGERVLLSELAFNDAWVERSSGQTALIRILVNGEERIRRLRGDGVLVSTAAGSTAYSQALGASPVPVGAPLIQVVGSNVVAPAQWRPVHLDQEDQVEFEVIDNIKRPCRCFVDSVDVGNVTRMLVRSSRVAGVTLAFSRSCDLQHKLYQMQFPKTL